jgi:hypothetical protein
LDCFFFSPIATRKVRDPNAEPMEASDCLIENGRKRPKMRPKTEKMVEEWPNFRLLRTIFQASDQTTVGMVASDAKNITY